MSDKLNKCIFILVITFIGILIFLICISMDTITNVNGESSEHSPKSNADLNPSSAQTVGSSSTINAVYGNGTNIGDTNNRITDNKPQNKTVLKRMIVRPSYGQRLPTVMSANNQTIDRVSPIASIPFEFRSFLLRKSPNLNSSPQIAQQITRPFTGFKSMSIENRVERNTNRNSKNFENLFPKVIYTNLSPILENDFIPIVEKPVNSIESKDRQEIISKSFRKKSRYELPEKAFITTRNIYQDFYATNKQSMPETNGAIDTKGGYPSAQEDEEYFDISEGPPPQPPSDTETPISANQRTLDISGTEKENKNRFLINKYDKRRDNLINNNINSRREAPIPPRQRQTIDHYYYKSSEIPARLIPVVEKFDSYDKNYLIRDKKQIVEQFIGRPVVETEFEKQKQQLIAIYEKRRPEYDPRYPQTVPDFQTPRYLIKPLN